MTYLPRNRSSYAYLKRVAVLIVILILGSIGFYVFRGPLITLISPLWQAENVISRNIGKGVTYFSNQQTLVEENMLLKERVSSLETEVVSLMQDKDEKNILLEQMGRRTNLNAVFAAVLTHPPQTPYDVVIVDVGSQESIKIGSEVSLPEGVILGQVSEVYSTKSKVTLYSSNGEETNALLERGSVPVTLIGRGGGNFRLTVPRDTVVEVGDRIVSPGISSELLGVVGEVNLNLTDSFKEVLAKSPTNIFTLRFVFVTP